MSSPKRTSAERRIERHINAGQQKHRVDDVSHQVRQCRPGRADVAKRGRPLYDDEQDGQLIKAYAFDMKILNLVYASHFQWMRGFPERAPSSTLRTLS